MIADPLQMAHGLSKDNFSFRAADPIFDPADMPLAHLVVQLVKLILHLAGAFSQRVITRFEGL